MQRICRSILVAFGVVLALAPAAWAGSYSFVDIDYPVGATTLNDMRGLNNQGQIVGSYTLGGSNTPLSKTEVRIAPHQISPVLTR